MERKIMGKIICVQLLTYLYVVTSVTLKLHLKPRRSSMIFTLQRQSTTGFDGQIKLSIWSNTRLEQAKERKGFVEILIVDAEKQRCSQHHSQGAGLTAGQRGRGFSRLWLSQVHHATLCKACFTNTAIQPSGPADLLRANWSIPAWAQLVLNRCDTRHHWMCTQVVLFFSKYYYLKCCL